MIGFRPSWDARVNSDPKLESLALQEWSFVVNVDVQSLQRRRLIGTAVGMSTITAQKRRANAARGQ
ncbi:hypothetical protein A2803_01385 [Candidatus Woesebacteria bacterium RIFCSPHIGHO2_01_FULL_44_21]|uniref:Uncharacterized protein n=1 Tax=Candidatus Woesebacteria bacterium RIFCSPHIGHO2_01_FULL_44_21 TaxID=1802503 RepID=A0A1F7YZA2_9BACT|nr:MAG: hypothetical protein A2803_01385 [Candidatus Woesebacteria bacterium RIFCSPHIGHO2_01_FULL_44_21]OGM70843.1 MAG: hypothetical protein A2897_05375 [Candidatus Woesebacteria bacterium RIFCSPLOWO2_01_FULL_44_24b]